MAIKIETFTDSKGETRFRVVAENGQTTLTPHEGYTRKEDCHRAIEENFSAIVKAIYVPGGPDDGLLVVDEDGSRYRLGPADDDAEFRYTLALFEEEK